MISGVPLRKMLTKIKLAISHFVLGEAVSDTEEIYRDNDGKFRIHLGLFRKDTSKTVWLKFTHRSFITRSSLGIGIKVGSFQEFANFFGSSFRREISGMGEPRKIPFFVRMILKASEGVRQSRFLDSYSTETNPKIMVRLFSYTNRRRRRRAVLEHVAPGESTYEVFDLEVLPLLEREILNRQA